VIQCRQRVPLADMILLNGALLLASLQTVVALALAPLPRIKNVVTFGDSFTDTKITGDGAVAWPDYLAGHANLSLYPFARAGGSCSNEVTYRPWPSVMETQVPTFLGQLRNGTIEIKQSETLYTLWIGTNDVYVSSITLAFHIDNRLHAEVLARCFRVTLHRE
jgi:phospholipase/lecithinase/hemolysin